MIADESPSLLRAWGVRVVGGNRVPSYDFYT